MKPVSIATAALVSITGAVLYSQTSPAAPNQILVKQYCVGCHNQKANVGNLVLETLNADNAAEHPEIWEKAIRKIRAGLMPPAGMPRPSRAVLDGLATRLEDRLDRAALAKPNPGATALHRLNRAEYANAVRDLIGLEVDASSLLPADDSSEGFDNVADVLAVSPALLERYLSAAIKISRAAVGDPASPVSTVTYEIPKDVVRNREYAGPQLGALDGVTFSHTFALDAEYVIRVRGAGITANGGGGRGRGGAAGAAVPVRVIGNSIARPQAQRKLTVTINDVPVSMPANGGDIRVPIKAGPQTIGVELHRAVDEPDDEMWSPGVWRASRRERGISSIAIIGPYKPTGPGDTPVRKQIFICRPSGTSDEVPCAKKILANLARHAYRRPATDGDVEVLMGFYQTGRNKGTFDSGIEMALRRLLASPEFVFRFEREPANVAASVAYRIGDLELASRLSFFLWSSIPDEELLNLGAQNKLHEPAVLTAQVARMLRDPRSHALVENFAGQWLFLRDLDSRMPQTPDFDENLKNSIRRETEMFFENLVQEDRNVLDLLNADYTFVDERLARHYQIPGVYGDYFRKVKLPSEERRGILGQASLLMVTSLDNRTSPVARGKWILENLMGTPAPVPPPSVPPLKEQEGAKPITSVRERLQEHRANPVCAGCHKIMDPIGFSLENFDNVGRWRTVDGTSAVDPSGELVDGTKIKQASDLRKALASRSDVFVQTMTERMMTYAMGRAVQYFDMPAVRAVAHESAANGFRFSTLVTGIVKSVPFQMRVKGSEGIKTALR